LETGREAADCLLTGWVAGDFPLDGRVEGDVAGVSANVTEAQTSRTAKIRKVIKLLSRKD
jgi:hypothetical protein